MISDLAIPNVTKEEIENIDTAKLRKVMLQGTYILELFLFSQASAESQRVSNNRIILKDLEERLFSEETLSRLDGDDLLQLYKAVGTSLNNGLKFMQDLHKNVASSMETIKNIERISIQETNSLEDEPVSRKEVEAVRKMIKERIAQKVQEKAHPSD